MMGAGIAKEFHRRYPEMYKSYRAACQSGMLALGNVYMYANPEDNRIVANIATQQFAGKHAHLWAVKLGVENTVRQIRTANLKSLALPQIGCGIGGLEWPKVKEGLEGYSEAYGIEIVVYKFSP